MNEKQICYSFEAWTKSNVSEILNNDTIKIYSDNLKALIEKVKLFNKVACFECWTSIIFYKWEVTFFENDFFDREIIDSDYFPEMIGANKIKVWGVTYEI